MIKISTEFGVNIALEGEISAVEQTCMEYPYTVSLCLKSMATVGNMDAVLAIRGIKDRHEESKIREAVSHYYQTQIRLPDVVLAFAAAGCAIADSFPQEKLSMVAAKQEATWDAFYFGTAHIRQGAREIPVPDWLNTDFHKAWKNNTANEICARVHTDRPVLSLHLPSLDVAVKEYSPQELKKAMEVQLTRIIDQRKLETGKNFRGRRATKGNEGPSLKR